MFIETIDQKSSNCLSF